MSTIRVGLAQMALEAPTSAATTGIRDATNRAHAEQPAVVANGSYVGAINRVGEEAPWNIGRFHGSSYVIDPRGRVLAQSPGDCRRARRCRGRPRPGARSARHLPLLGPSQPGSLHAGHRR